MRFSERRRAHALRRWASAGLGILALAAGAWPRDEHAAAHPQVQVARDWRLVVLGVAQDAGIPHLGCRQELCASIRAGRRARERVSCLGLIERVSGRAYLFDATPDFVSQIDTLTGGRVPDGIFLTHAHIGHYTGLMYLGRESVGARGVPVHATERMSAFLRDNGPWSQLVKLGNIELRRLVHDVPVPLGGGVSVSAFQVPHRDELSDTVGYRIEGPRRKAVFIPDIDRWEKWERSVRDLAERVDIALVDGTFSSPAELGEGRRIEEVPHPLMPHTRELLRGTRARLLFIHVNHTNAALGAPDVARDGMELEL